MRTLRLGCLALLVTALLGAVPPGADAQRRGGIIRVGVLGDPTTANLVECDEEIRRITREGLNQNTEGLRFYNARLER